MRTAGFALFALGDGIPVLPAASVLSGPAGALFSPAVRTCLAQESGERRAEAFALVNVFATTGTYFRLFYVISGLAAAAGNAAGNAAVGAAMDASDRAPWGRLVGSGEAD